MKVVRNCLLYIAQQSMCQSARPITREAVHTKHISSIACYLKHPMHKNGSRRSTCFVNRSRRLQCAQKILKIELANECKCCLPECHKARNSCSHAYLLHLL